MRGMFERYGLRAIAAAALAFAAVLLAAPKPSAAASYTLNFTGTATEVGSPFTALGAAVGDSVSGTITFDPFNTLPTGIMPPAFTVFSQASAVFSFNISNPGLDLTLFDSSDGFAATSSTGDQLLLSGGAGTTPGNLLMLTFEGQGTGGGLTSLAGLPTTSDGIISFLGGGLGQASGVFELASGGLIKFDIDLPAPATTPIPATLPLFISALGGLGFIALRRRRGAA
jgi:hypothetical protein